MLIGGGKKFFMYPGSELTAIVGILWGRTKPKEVVPSPHTHTKKKKFEGKKGGE